ncbi:LOW QUALITY PROTEIN: Atg9p [Coccidioides immitis RMSCC 3703]|uniref:Autophagy-related protein 9 n=1 Tax=Coccidioides immitis RMSCC 3703 TaxID=454286 RepID=A0A0J8QTP2_COCIT|nr:LOW QUALITY PROTEIN: Atg9p [Coccidioides immitis RMSCC 3703]
MTSQLITRLLPINSTTSPSIYETIRQYDDDSGHSDTEERAAMAVDEENLDGAYQDYELEGALGQASDTQSTHSSFQSPAAGDSHLPRHPKWTQESVNEAEHDDEVPASLLVEGDGEEDPLPPPPRPPSNRSLTMRQLQTSAPPRLRGPVGSCRGASNPPSCPSTIASSKPSFKSKSWSSISQSKEKAMWRWANVENLDNFLKDVYIYFIGNGIWCIVLSRMLNILTLAFVVGFTTFLTNCVDYRKVPHSKTLNQIIVPKCTNKMSASSTFFLWLFTVFWFGKVFQYIIDFRRLRHMHDFYLYLLDVPDSDIQTISWQEVVGRLMALRDANPATAGTVSTKHRKYIGSQSKQRMDAHDIANRLMRKENYLIALFNKEILDLTLPIPFLRNRQLFSRTLEWNLNLCILDYVFNEQGQLRPLFLKATHRRALSEGLRRRFIFAGVMNIFIAPFIVAYFLMHYFFRYFNEYQKNPSKIGSRQYTPLAEWKFREFNELWHLFERRIHMSYESANMYINQFPKDKTVQLSRFVAFIAGALLSVLALASVIDPELFLGFEITHDRTVLFYIGLFGTVYAVARGVVPDDAQVFDPEHALLDVTAYTHYKPAHWQGKLHSDDVRKEFATLYQLKVVIFLEEILIHVDGLGYVCSFAVFDFKKGTNLMPPEPQHHRPRGLKHGLHDLRGDYFSAKDGKMLASYYGFLDHYAPPARPSGPHASQRQNYPQQPVPGPTHRAQPGANHLHSSRIDRWDNGQHSTMRQSALRTSRFGAITGVGGHASPMASMLLDPHHQPSMSGFRSKAHPTAASRYRPSRQAHPMADTIQDVDEDQLPGINIQPSNVTTTSSGGPATDDSQIEESWRINLAEDANSGEDDEAEDVEKVAGGGGVLGLIHQFQKVTNEGRGAVGM